MQKKSQECGDNVEEFIQYKELLLLKHEYAQGASPSPKVNKERHKLVKSGKAKIVEDTE